MSDSNRDYLDSLEQPEGNPFFFRGLSKLRFRFGISLGSDFVGAFVATATREYRLGFTRTD